MRFGIIGCGKMVEEYHLPVLMGRGDVQITCVADVDLERARRVARKLGLSQARASSDYRDVLARSDVDAVNVGTPPASHCEIAVVAAEAGKHVLVEKPMCVSVAEADRMIEAARRHGVVLSVHHNYLWFAENQVAKRVIEEGAIGDLLYTTISCLGLPFFGGAWRYDPRVAGGGILLDMLHLVYLTNWFFGGLPEAVSARVDRIREEKIGVEDFGLMRLEYPKGYGQINVSWGMGWGGTQMMGTRGRLLYVYDHFTTVNYERPVEICVLTDQGRFYPEIPPSPPFSAGPIEQFIDAVREGTPPLVSGRDGRHAVEVVMAAYKSAVLDRSIALPLPADDPVYQRGIAALADLGGRPYPARQTGGTLT